MSNLKGAILATALFAAVVFPFLLMMSIDAFQQHAFLKMTEEVTELVKEEGGVSEHVSQVVQRLKKKDLTVTFSKPGLVKFGEEIVIGYKYNYQNVRGKKTLDGQDKIVIMKRSTGKNGGNSNEPNLPTEIAKSYSTKTPESLQPDKEYTFTVPGLKNLLGVSADMGKVEVVRVEGEKVTVRVSGGKVVKTIQTGGTNTLADEKYVTGEDSAAYNQNGYTGTLERYLYSGKLMPADSKVITTTKTSLFTSVFPGSIAYASDGYSGILLKNGDPIKTLFSGEYTHSDTKWIEGATAENYNHDGYVGTLERYTVSGEYIPEKNITDSLTSMTNTFPDTIVKDGVTLYRTGDSKKSILTEQETKNISIEVAGPRWHWAKETPSSTYNYSKDGYIGTLQAIGNPTYSTKHSSEWAPAIVGMYNTNYHSNNLSELNGQVKDIKINPNGRLNGESAIEYIVRSNEATLRAIGRVNPKIIENSIRWKSSIEYGNFLYNGIYYPYKRVITADYTFDAFRWFQVYGGNVTKDAVYQYTQEYSAVLPASDSRVYAYKGYVTKPATDTRIYEYVQNYTGTVTRTEMDTRIYKYRGTVVRPASDTRTYEDYYQYELNFQYK
ncbi:hypothetical protein [Lysinibacillus capsici]|uniref:hypothetical protein n=1 Tax=Lysinibacillus capsici TaxID=2115968 RepID=UPI0034E45E01